MRKDLPSPNAPNFGPRVREEIHALLGKTGRDRALMLQDALDTGLLISDASGSLVVGIQPVTVDGTEYVRDLTPPPQPTGFDADAAISHVNVWHDAPLYTQGHGHMRTRVYGAKWVSGPLPVFADAVEIDQFSGVFRSIPSDPATTWRLWVKWESVDGVLSPTPAGGTNGVAARTGEDVAKLLEALAGQITSTELHASLGTPIGQIPSISATAADALAQAQANLAAINTIENELANLSSTPDYSAATTYAVGDIVRYNGGLYRATAPTTGNLPTNTAFWQKIGDYASLGDAVAGHAAMLSDHETRITTNANGLTAQANTITTLQSGLTAATGSIATKADASAVTALDTRVTATENSNTSQAAQITSLQSDLTSASNTLATKADASAVTALDTRITETEAANTSQATQITNLQSSLASTDNTVATKADASALNTIGTTVASQGQSLTTQAQQITSLQAAQTAANDAIATKADSSALNSLNATVTGQGTALTSQAQSLAVLSSQVSNPTTGLDSKASTAALSQVETNSAAAVATSQQTLRAEMAGIEGSMAASLQVEANTRAAQTGELYAQYTVKLDVGGLISGYGLASTASNATPTSAFGVQAGQFFVAPPTVAQATPPTDDLFKGFVWRNTSNNTTYYYDGAGWSTTPTAFPFVIQTTPQVINGFTVAPGIYGEAAFFARLVATRGQIGLLAVDDARIANVSVDKLTAGTIAVGQYIQGTGYTPGLSGWRINGDGTAEFSEVVVRGTIFASQGAIGGWNIGANYLQSTTYALGSTGTRLNSDGTGQIGGLTIASTLTRSTSFTDSVNGFELSGAGVIRAFSNSGQNVLNTGATGTQFLLKAGDAFSLRGNGELTTTGRVQSPDGRSYFEPKAQGTAPILMVRDSSFTERVRIEADGRATFSDVVFSRANRLTSGVWSRPAGYPEWDFYTTASTEDTPSAFVGGFAARVLTGYGVSEAINVLEGPGFIGRAKATGTFYFSNPYQNGYIGMVPIIADVEVLVNHSTSGASGPAGGEISLRLVCYDIHNKHPWVSHLRITQIEWALLRLT